MKTRSEEYWIRPAVRSFEDGLPRMEKTKKCNSSRLMRLVDRYTREINRLFEVDEKKIPDVLATQLIGICSQRRATIIRVLRSRGWVLKWDVGSIIREKDGSIAWRRKAA